MQDCSQILRCNEPPLSRLVAQYEDPILGFAVEAGVTYEMQDVKFIAAQLSLQDRKPGCCEALEPYLPAADEPCQGLVQTGPLAFDIEGGIVGRARDHHQNFERRIDFKGSDALRQVEVADERRIFRQRQEAVEPDVVEVFPRDIIEPRCVGNAQTQPCVLRLGFAQAAAPAVPDIAADALAIAGSRSSGDRLSLPISNPGVMWFTPAIFFEPPLPSRRG